MGLTPIVRWQVFDEDGVPVSGAKLYPQLSGTSTPSVVYADAALTTPLAYPVEADAGGVFPAMFLGAWAYRFLVTDANDVTLFPAQDNIDDLVTNADIASGAAIAYSKLNLTGSIVNADISASAAIGWTKVSKTGSSLADFTTRSASDLSSGTLPDARFPATLPAVSGANLTNLDASDLASGTVPDGRFPATLPAASGVNLTALNASNVASGSLAQGRLSNVLGSAWANITKDTIVQATTDLLVIMQPDASSNLELRTDASNPPTTVRAYVDGSNLTTTLGVVRKGDYYTVVSGGGGTVTMLAGIPLGT